MAVYEYRCTDCGLRKEKLLRGDPPEKIECASCGANAERMLSDFGFQFADGKVPGNTGVYSLDSDHDKRIARDAKSRWEIIKDRNTEKRRVQRDHGGEGKVPLSKNAEGEYVPMKTEQVERFQKLQKESADYLRKRKEEKASD